MASWSLWTQKCFEYGLEVAKKCAKRVERGVIIFNLREKFKKQTECERANSIRRRREKKRSYQFSYNTGANWWSMMVNPSGIWDEHSIVEIVKRSFRRTVQENIGEIEGVQADLCTTSWAILDNFKRNTTCRYQCQFLSDIIDGISLRLDKAVFTSNKREEDSKFKIRQFWNQISDI